MTASEAPPSAPRTSLGELARVFLRLGTTAFGGPAAHVALMEDEVVRRRRWVDEQRFLDLLSVANLIPGPTSTELAIHIGWHRRRWSGLVVAGVSFIVPAMLLTGILGWAYVTYGALPAIADLLYGVKPVMLAVVAQAFTRLVPRAARTWPLRVLGAGAVVASALGAHELAVLAVAGVASLAWSRAWLTRGPPVARAAAGGLGPLLVGPAAVAATQAAVSVASIFGVFLKVGAVLFGSGYVLLAFLRGDLVERLHWLTEAQLMDAIAVGQVTPGPVFTTATFVGYVLAGPWGALAATAGIFLPAFVYVAAAGPFVPRLRRSPVFAAVLDGVNVASLALMVVVTVQLASASLVDVPTVVLALGAAAALLWRDVDPTPIIAGGALAGLVMHAL